MLESPLRRSFSSISDVEQESVSATSTSSRVLLIDADEKHRGATARFLAKHGYEVFHADSGAAACAILEVQPVDVVILDVLVPGADGLSIARKLSVRTELCVIIVSELGSELDRIIGLEAGADDYLAKPVSQRELLARIRAVRRRTVQAEWTETATSPAYGFAGWVFDTEARVLRDPQGQALSLPDGQFALLRTFVQHPQRVLTRDQLLELASGPSSDAYDRAIDTQVSRLRRRLRTRCADDLIRTVRSEGYMFLPRVIFR
jgi:two-component system OmpR family response regulator